MTKMKTLLIGAALAVGIAIMAAAYDGCTAFLTSMQTCAINTETSLVSSANTIRTIGQNKAAVYLYCAGTDPACAEDVTFYFERSPDNGTTWVRITPIVLTLLGQQQVYTDATVDLDLTSTSMLRLGAVHNAETVAGRTVKVQAYIQYPQ